MEAFGAVEAGTLADQAEAPWSLLMPILDVWKSAPPSDFTGDASGAWGPEAAESLLAQDGRAWLQPTSLNMTQRPPPASDVC